MHFIFGRIDKQNKQIEAIGHRWDMAINEGRMPIDSLINPGLRADCLLPDRNFASCMTCKDFKRCYPTMLFSNFLYSN